MTSHAPGAHSISPAKLLLACAVTILAAGVELTFSSSGHSLFLAADAIHLLAHLLVFLALWTQVWAGSDRFEDWAANAVLGLVLCIAGGIVVSAIRGLMDGHTEAPEPSILLFSILGLTANVICAYLFRNPAEDYRSFRAALVHEISDASMTLISLFGALFIKLYGWTWVDPVLSFCVGAWLFGWAVRQMTRRVSDHRCASCVEHRRP